MAGGIVAGIVGQIAGQVVNQAMSSIMSQFGGGQMAGAFANIFNDALGSGMKEAINSGPLPQFVKDAANSAIDDVVGNNQQDTSPECQKACEESDWASMMRNFLKQACEEARDEADKTCDGKRKGGGSPHGSMNWLEALAGAMGDIQNKFLNKVMESREKLEASAGEDSKDGQKDFIEAQNEFQAQMQMFKQMSELASTCIKTIGEALGTLARKQ
jgi:hypothetical protein